MDTAQGVGRERKGVHRPCWLRRAASLQKAAQEIANLQLSVPSSSGNFLIVSRFLSKIGYLPLGCKPNYSQGRHSLVGDIAAVPILGGLHHQYVRLYVLTRHRNPYKHADARPGSDADSPCDLGLLECISWGVLQSNRRLPLRMRPFKP